MTEEKYQHESGDKRVVIVANHREVFWDQYVLADPNKNRLPQRVKLSMELRIENRFMDMIDLINYAHDSDSLNKKPTDCPISKDDNVTLNGIFVSDYLLRHGYQVDLIKNFITGKEHLAALLQNEPLAVIISSTFMNLGNIKEIVAYMRPFISAATHIIIGGPTIHYAVKFYPEILTLYGAFLKSTFLVAEKQGERSLLRLLTALAAGTVDTAKRKCDIPNIMVVDDRGDIVSSSAEEENNDINDHIIDWKNLPEHLLSRVMSIRTSHGCPFQCAFCTFWVLHPRPMFKTFGHIADELQSIDRRHKIRHLMVTDDTLNVNAARIQSFCRTIIDNNISVGWSAFLRSTPLTREITALLKEANCKLVHIGFESFDDQILKNMNKRETAADHLRAIELLKEAEIGVLGSFIFGFPGETEDSMRRTISMINRSGIDVTELYSFVYYPYAPISKRREEFQLSGEIFDWRHRTMNSRELFQSLLPEAIGNLKNYGLLEWDNWGTVALLDSHGVSMDQIKQMYALKHRMIKMQNRNQSFSTSGTEAFKQMLGKLREFTIN